MGAVILIDMETTNNTTPDRVLTTVITESNGFRIVVTRCYYSSDSHTIKSYRCRTLAGARKFELECHAEATA